MVSGVAAPLEVSAGVDCSGVVEELSGVVLPAEDSGVVEVDSSGKVVELSSGVGEVVGSLEISGVTLDSG